MWEKERKLINSNLNTVLKITSNSRNIHKVKCLKDSTHDSFVDLTTGLISCPICRYQMDIVDLTADLLALTEDESIYSILKSKFRKEISKELICKIKEIQAQKDLFMKINEEAMEVYKNMYKGSKNAQDYVKQRGLTKEIMQTFHIGYAGKNTIINTLGKKYSHKLLHEVGLLGFNQDNNSYYDMYSGRLMFPILNKQNRVVGFGGRTIFNSPTKDKYKKPPKYINSKTTDIFHKSHELYGINMLENKKYDFILCSEGYMDVVTLHQYGVINAVANLGTAITPYHIKLLSKYTDNIVLMLDGDEAGKNAMIKTLTKIESDNLYTVVLPDNLDPDEFLQKKSSKELISYIKENKLNWTESVLNYSLEKENQEENFFEYFFIQQNKKCY